MRVTLRCGYGAWETTHFPIGGAFRRAGAEGISGDVLREFPWYKGCTAEIRTPDGRTFAVDLQHCEPSELVRVG